MTTPGGSLNAAAGGSGVVYIAVVSRDVEAACAGTGGLGAFLSYEESSAASRFTRAGDRLDYAASHALFRLLGAYRLGLHPRDAAGLSVTRHCVGCGSAEHGKPAIDGVSLSLSRSRGAVMAAAGPAGAPVGADIEHMPDSLFSGFDQYVASPAERLQLTHGDLAPRLQLWSAKEAVLKAAGLGLAVSPSAVHLAPADSTVPEHLPGAVVAAVCPGLPAVHGLLATATAAPAGYKAAVSAGAGLPPARLPLSELLPVGSRPASRDPGFDAA